MQNQKRPKLLPKVLVELGALILGAYLVVHLVINQMAISAKRQQLQDMQNQLTVQQAQNAELSRILENGSDMDIVERVARDTLGYAKPNERVFVDMSGK